MTCHQMLDAEGNIVGYLCTATIYKFPHAGRDWLFEFSRHNGPWPLRKDTHDPFVHAPKTFWTAFDAFLDLSDEEQIKYRI